MEKHWKHPQWKKLHRKSHADHSHLVTLNPWKFLTWGKAPVVVPEKENCIRMEKDICTKFGQLMQVEVVLWIGLWCGHHNYPPFGDYGLVPWESDPVLGKTHCIFRCEYRKLCTSIETWSFWNFTRKFQYNHVSHMPENQRWHQTLQNSPRLNQTKFN